MTDPYRTADVLGPIVREHRSRASQWQVVMGLFFAVLGLFLIYLFGWPPRGWAEGSLEGGCALFAALAWFAAWSDRGMHVVVHERGVVQHLASKATTILFDDLESIRSEWVRVSGSPTESHTLRAANGEAIHVTHGVEKVAQLVEHVRSRTHDRLLKAAVDAILAGERVRFGPIEACSEGLVVGEDVVAWSGVALGLEHGRLRIAGAGEVEVKEIPNLFVLLALPDAIHTHAALG